MSAMQNDLLRIQEMYDIATQTMSQINELDFTQERFVNTQSTQDQLIAEGLANRVFRITEEGGKLSEIFKEYGFELHEMSGLRNRLVHAYGTIDMEIVWNVLANEFPKVIDGCERYCADNGIDLHPTWE